MPRRCGLGCTPTRGVLHVFPNPDKFPEQFKAWVRVVCGQDECTFNYKNMRICNRHFTEKDRNRYNRLNALAVPSLFLREQASNPCGLSNTPSEQTFNQPEVSDGKDNVILHSFPNPTKEDGRFRTWLYSIGGDILDLDSQFVFKNRRVCQKHFEIKYHTRSSRLSANAVPTLHLTEVVNHTFPNPGKFPEKFKAWVQVVFGQDECNFNYRNKVICDRHFTEKDRNRNNRLNALAVPSLFLHEQPRNTSGLSNSTSEQNLNQPEVSDNYHQSSSESAGHLHVFPNPNRFPEQFKKWVQIVGGELNTSDDYEFYRKKRLCDRHFAVKDKNRCNRLNALAVPSLSDVTTTIEILENSTVKSVSATYSTVVDVEEDPLKITKGPISHTSFFEDVPSPYTAEDISCPSPIMDVPSPQAEEVTISCTSPIVDYSPPKPSVVQQALYTGSHAFADLKHTYSKLPVPAKSNVATPYSKFQVLEKSNVAAPYSKFPVPEKSNVAAPHSKFQVPQKCYVSDGDFCKENGFVSLSDYKCQQRQISLLKRQVRSLQKRCISYKNRLAQASKPSVAFQKVTKNMTEPAKLFTKMQFTQTHKKPGGRRFSSEDKNFSLSLYKTSPQSYSFFANWFTLPSTKTIKAMLAKEKLEPFLTLDKNATLPSNKTLVQEKLQPYLTLDKNSTSTSKITLKDMLARDNFEPFLTIEQNCSLPLRITLKDILAHKQLEPHQTLKKNSTSPSKQTRVKDILAHKQLEPYLTLKKNSTSPSKQTRVKEKPEPRHYTFKKKSTLPSKKALKGILAQESLEPYLTFNKNSTKSYIAKGRTRTVAE